MNDARVVHSQIILLISRPFSQMSRFYGTPVLLYYDRITLYWFEAITIAHAPATGSDDARNGQ
uniref:Uncharacterized protein n=1 Tax=Candidatus Kentrum sp. LFY TaxID=2126342 RepID=A0A450VAI4_9GAMM|nr:MAG: hypothetical protein BECKLFY1418A_GA0070994_11613 [Candidatus Kentron sp. LFY]